MPTDKPSADELVGEYNLLNNEIDECRRRMAELSFAKRVVIAQLRSMMPVAEIAQRLGISAAAVYKIAHGDLAVVTEHQLPDVEGFRTIKPSDK